MVDRQLNAAPGWGSHAALNRLAFPVRRGSIVQLVTLGVVIGAAATLVALLVPWLPPDASEERDRIDFVFWFTTAICIAIFALVAAVIVYSVIKFRAGPDDDSDGPPIHGHTGLEIVWTACRRCSSRRSRSSAPSSCQERQPRTTT